MDERTGGWETEMRLTDVISLCGGVEVDRVDVMMGIGKV